MKPKEKIKFVSIKPIIKCYEKAIKKAKARYSRYGLRPDETEAEYNRKIKKVTKLLEWLKKYEEKNQIRFS